MMQSNTSFLLLLMLLTNFLSWTQLILKSVKQGRGTVNEEHLVVTQQYYEVRNMVNNASTGCYYAADDSNTIILLNSYNGSSIVSAQTNWVAMESSQTYFQVLYQTSASSSGEGTTESVDVLLHFINQQIQKYLIQPCTDILLHQDSDQSLPYYRQRQTTEYNNSIFALTSSVTAVQNQTCNNYDDNSFNLSSSTKMSCFVMEHNSSFYCHGTCSTETKLSIHDSFHNFIVNTNNTQIDWETGTVLYRITSYTFDYKKNEYKMGDNSTSLRHPTTSKTNTSTITLLIEILPGIVILLVALGSILFVKRIRKKIPNRDNPLSYEESNSNSLVTDIDPAESIDEVKSIEFSLGSQISQRDPIQQNTHFLQEGAPSTLLPDGNYAVEIGREPKPTIDANFHHRNGKDSRAASERYICTADKASIQNWFQSVLQKPFFLHFGSNSNHEEEEEEGSSVASSFEDSSLELSVEDYRDTISTIQTALSMISSTQSIPVEQCEDEAVIAPYDELLQLESPKSDADPRSLHQQPLNHNKSQSPSKPSILKNSNPLGFRNVGMDSLPKKKSKQMKVSFALPEDRQNSSSSFVIEEEERIEIFYNAGSKNVLAAFISK